MINSNMLRLLDKYAFGADIDSLESSIIDYELTKQVADVSLYASIVDKLKAILEELKPESKAFSNNIKMDEIPFNNYDELFSTYNNAFPAVAYGTSDSGLALFSDKIRGSKDDKADIVAIDNLLGIDISCIYYNGYLCNIFVIGEYAKFMLITDEFSSKIPKHIPEFDDDTLVDLRGRIVISNEHSHLQRISLNEQCAVMRCLRTKTHIDKLDIIFYNAYFKTDYELPYSTQWEKYEFLEKCGLTMAKYKLVRNVWFKTLDKALLSIDNSFISDDIEYISRGFIVKINDELNDSIDSCLYFNSTDCSVNNVYSSIVKSIATIYEDSIIKQQVKIVDVDCNNRLSIDTIDIDDIYDFEKYNIGIGNKIYFTVSMRKAVLCSGDNIK